MESSVAQLIEDENLFSHFVDETLLFDKEIHSLYAYPSDDHSCLKVLTRPECLQKWLQLEQKCEFVVWSQEIYSTICRLALTINGFFSRFKFWVWRDRYRSRPIKRDIQVQPYWLRPWNKEEFQPHLIGLDRSCLANPGVWNVKQQVTKLTVRLQMVL